MQPALPPTVRPVSSSMEPRPPSSSSSGSAGTSPELVQAEVARQLEAAMGDLQLSSKAAGCTWMALEQRPTTATALPPP